MNFKADFDGFDEIDFYQSIQTCTDAVKKIDESMEKLGLELEVHMQIKVVERG